MLEKFRDVFGPQAKPAMYLYTKDGILPSRPVSELINFKVRGGAIVHRGVQLAHANLRHGPHRFELDDLVRVVVGWLADLELVASVLES